MNDIIIHILSLVQKRMEVRSPAVAWVEFMKPNIISDYLQLVVLGCTSFNPTYDLLIFNGESWKGDRFLRFERAIVLGGGKACCFVELLAARLCLMMERLVYSILQ